MHVGRFFMLYPPFVALLRRRAKKGENGKLKTERLQGMAAMSLQRFLIANLKLLFFFKKVVIPINIFSSIKFFKIRNIITTVISVNSPLV